ncbi:AMP-binding protein [Microbulbifer halophilus]|uniref:AMP-binding protein n=1 Tax=Microbulbifer halophilus TaxID=453963 RepID=A0ABW5E6C9_9GAMM|nr:AMP-binding protein [Microbulbifer halophilus]MCW8127251.1 AMP-binding protein [Microbulbifer halophilus]
MQRENLPRTEHWVAQLRRSAAQQPDRTVFEFLADAREVSERLTCGELDRRARGLASRLQALAGPGTRVLMPMPNGIDYVVGFFAVLYAGMIAVTAYRPPHKRRGWQRILAIAGDCDAGLLLADAGGQEAVSDWAREQSLSGPVLAVSPGDGERAGQWREPEIRAGDIALLQYSSGSTGAPKGVAISHANLLHNADLIRREMGLVPTDIFVSWLPLFHDMGLIGQMLTPLLCGCRTLLTPPPLVVQQPFRWLELMSRSGATVSGGPNFIYDHCVERISPERMGALDLSNWRIAFNGSEPVRAATLERFARHFAAAGLAPGALAPCYGLAEATLMVTGTAGGDGYATLTVDESELARGRVRPADSGRTLVSSGRPNGEMQVRIVDPAEQKPLPDGEVGEIWVRGASVAGGYWRREELSAEALGARLNGEGPYLRTGDLGFLHGGRLFVCGRIKELIQIRGRNHYPQDIEATAQAVSPHLVAHGGAAFSLESGDCETAVLVQEVDRRGAGKSGAVDRSALIREICAAVAAEHDLQLQALALIAPASLPRTTSGKIQRTAARSAYDLGELRLVEHWRAEGGERELSPALPAGDADGIARWICHWIAAQTRRPLEQITPDLPLEASGLDSVAGMTLNHELSSRLGVRLQPDILWRYPTVESLARYLASPEEAQEEEETWQEGLL